MPANGEGEREEEAWSGPCYDIDDPKVKWLRKWGMTYMFSLAVAVSVVCSPFIWMRRKRSYGMQIRYQMTAKGFVVWAGDKLSINGASFFMSEYRGMIHEVLKETAEALGQLCFLRNADLGGLPRIPWAAIEDDWSNKKLGHFFLRDQRNREWVDNYLMGHIMGPKGTVAESWGKYNQRDVKFLDGLLFLVHLTGGGPARGTEITPIRVQNTAKGSLRNVLVQAGMVCVATRYHKGYVQSGQYKIAIRFLPQEVGQLLKNAGEDLHPRLPGLSSTNSVGQLASAFSQHPETPQPQPAHEQELNMPNAMQSSPPTGPNGDNLGDDITIGSHKTLVADSDASAAPDSHESPNLHVDSERYQSLERSQVTATLSKENEKRRKTVTIQADDPCEYMVAPFSELCHGLRSLGRGEWLNDIVINYVLRRTSGAECMHIDSLHLDEKRETSAVVYLDSLGEPPKEDATAKITGYLQALLDQEQPIPVAVGKSIRQQDMSNCGVAVIVNAVGLVAGRDLVAQSIVPFVQARQYCRDLFLTSAHCTMFHGSVDVVREALPDALRTLRQRTFHANQLPDFLRKVALQELYATAQLIHVEARLQKQHCVHAEILQMLEASVAAYGEESDRQLFPDEDEEDLLAEELGIIKGVVSTVDDCERKEREELNRCQEQLNKLQNRAGCFKRGPLC
ncbi:hypothetical protein CPLU01_15279 [Colletotrichum plurivorum]|uniref:Ubiquitin-like protease family profile domain-containing protein n=1 Tax=Colletotrichum plurivorum TaxID=2175906 RepID=A0A8H6JCF8_9PEZI|nr:hypothetical protein CPLU01_15279 [Colletotrichum plurivorum]